MINPLVFIPIVMAGIFGLVVATVCLWEFLERRRYKGRKEECQECEYFSAGNNECRHHSPSVVTCDSYLFPVVRPTDWCGEFEYSEKED